MGARRAALAEGRGLAYGALPSDRRESRPPASRRVGESGGRRMRECGGRRGERREEGVDRRRMRESGGRRGERW